MTMYVYATDGEPRGFLFETTIYGLDGTPLGRIAGCRVHRFDGSYAGEWLHQMVVERSTGRPRCVAAVPPPGRRAAVSPGYSRRSVAEYRDYPDAFDRLLERVSEAAE